MPGSEIADRSRQILGPSPRRRITLKRLPCDAKPIVARGTPQAVIIAAQSKTTLDGKRIAWSEKDAECLAKPSLVTGSELAARNSLRTFKGVVHRRYRVRSALALGLVAVLLDARREPKRHPSEAIARRRLFVAEPQKIRDVPVACARHRKIATGAHFEEIRSVDRERALDSAGERVGVF